MTLKRMFDLLKKIAKAGLGKLLRSRRLRLRRGIDVVSFLRELERLEVQYVVLRWFEHLPDVDAGEDLDILVADDSLETIKSFLSRSWSKSRTPCDVYSESGLEGSDFRGAAYYPPEFAAAILRNAVIHESGARVPCPEEHFNSLAFHALYHKGSASGLPPDAETPSPNIDPEHDYRLTLELLSSGLGMNISITIASLDEELDRRGLRPSLDLLLKWGTRNELCRKLAEDELANRRSVPGLAVFVVREAAASTACLTKIRERIVADGFVLVGEQSLNGTAVDRVTRRVRGGNWGKGPWRDSGGKPAYVIATVDPFSEPPSRRLLAKQPLADNARVFRTKDCLRHGFNAEVSHADRCNVIHASDDNRQAAFYLEVAVPELASAWMEHAVKISRSYLRPNEEVVKSLTRHGRRARVDLVRLSDDKLAVRKTYRPGYEHVLKREIQALRDLSKIDVDSVIPQLLDADGVSFLMPYYANRLRSAECRAVGCVSIQEARHTFKVAQRFYENGWEFLDFGPHNILIDDRGKITFIDFEFAFKTFACDSTPFCSSQTVIGPMADWTRDRPVSTTKNGKWYRRYWLPAVGVSFTCLMDTPSWRQGLVRVPTLLGFHVLNYLHTSAVYILRCVKPR